MTVEKAKHLCVEAHKGQFRRAKTTPISNIEKFKEDHPDYYIHTTFIINTYNIAEPYHTHPFAVANMMDTDEEKIVAYLHDVIEDTEAKLVALDGGYFIYFNYKYLPITKNVYIALYGITKPNTDPNKFKETGHYTSYEKYLKDLSMNKLATKVKIADMFHNMSSNPTEKQKQKYLNGIKILLKEI